MLLGLLYDGVKLFFNVYTTFNSGEFALHLVVLFTSVFNLFIIFYRNLPSITKKCHYQSEKNMTLMMC